MRLSVIIVNYNVKYFLEQCLFSVQKACVSIESEIIVVDNNSSDGSRKFLEPRFPKVNFIWNDSNIGFAAANNLALAAAKGDYILFLNPDTLVPEDCFTKCLNFLGTINDNGALGIKMIDGSGIFLKESKRAFPSPLTSLYKLAGLAGLFPKSKVFARYYLGHLSETENHEVDVLAGAYIMVPKKILNDIGGFDERFFMYGEDVDLSFRIQKAGNKNYFFAESSIIHFKGESTKRASFNYVKMFYTAMNLFVKKHYSGSGAKVLVFLLQLGIILRAILAATGNLLKKTGLPIFDAGIILAGFWSIKYLWSTYIRQNVNYSPNILIVALPAFTLVFLLAAYYSGLYDRGYKQAKLIRSTTVAGLVLLSGYGMLPENIRFSRGILVFGILTAFFVMNVMRRLFIQWRLLETCETEEEYRQTIVLSGSKDFKTIQNLMQEAGMQERVLGMVNDNKEESSITIGGVKQLTALVKKYQVKEIIFCENGVSYKEIINLLATLPSGIRNKFHASGSNSIVGSDSKDLSGDYVAGKKYKIAYPVNKRNKRLLDIVLSVLFIISFPVHVFFQKSPLGFCKNVFAVLFWKNTWVGYSTAEKQLPPIKKGILSSTSLPSTLNELPYESLKNNDEWYASEYSVMADLKKISKGYKYLYH